MSGYAEEALYPGSKEGHIYSVEDSSRVRHGQSLYNFGTESGDIGVYGNVFLFSEFLKELGGETVMHGIHDYVRTTSDSIPNDAGSLYEALGPDVVSTINESIVFPEGFTFAGEDQEFMSKLTLAYYCSLLNGSFAKPAIYDSVDVNTLLYDELDGCRIEGGGRVILATKDGKFQIPEGADSGLVYVGFDSDFNQVTNVIGK
jgi:hypothetical protein